MCFELAAPERLSYWWFGTSDKIGVKHQPASVADSLRDHEPLYKRKLIKERAINSSHFESFINLEFNYIF